MNRNLPRPLTLLTCLAVFYFLLWPVSVDPEAWDAPPNPGYTGPFAPNTRLAGLELLPIGDNRGPEDVALDAQGRIYVATGEGHIVRLQADGTRPERWADTGGRPLGIDFDGSGHLIVADALRGLLSIDTEGRVAELATEADGVPIRYADDVDVAADGRIYFSDASTKFGAKEYGGPYEASLLDIMEHGGHGRLLVYDPRTRTATTLASGLNFPNGVAVSHDQTSVLVSETGNYRVLRIWIEGRRLGQVEPVVEALPGFPDNISTGENGRFWVALISPRSRLLDGLSNQPLLRRVVQRLPRFLRPGAAEYGHVLAIDRDGRVLRDLQDPSGRFSLISSVVEAGAYLYFGSLEGQAVARLPAVPAILGPPDD
jgi:sugar lactone lactonase YvrE